MVEHLDRLSPGWKEHRDAALAEAKRKSEFIATATRAQVRAYMWKETQRRLGITYEEFDEQVRVWTLKEETYRRMSAENAIDAVVAAREAKQHFKQLYPRFNHHHIYDMVGDAFVRLVDKGIMFPVRRGPLLMGFSHNPCLPVDQAFLDDCRMRMEDLKLMQAESANVFE